MKKRLYTSYVYKRATVNGVKVLIQACECESGTEATKKAKEMAEANPGTAFCAGNMWPFVMTKEVKSVVYVDPEDPTKTLKDAEVEMDVEPDDEDEPKADATSGVAPVAETPKPVFEAPKAVVELPKAEPVPEAKPEPKPAAKPAATTPAAQKPAETNPVETKPVETNPVEDKPAGDGFTALFPEGAPGKTEPEAAPAGFVSADDGEEKTGGKDKTVPELF